MKKILIVIILISLIATGCKVNSRAFKDPNLRLGIEKELKQQGLTFSDIDELTSLDLSFLKIGSLVGIEKLTNIESLNLSNNVLNSIEELSYLKKLRILDLQNNNISDISPIKDLDKLEIILVRNNNIEDITVLSDKYENYLKTDFLVKIEFKDADLESNIRKQLKKKSEKITANDISKIRTIDLRGLNVKSLSGIEYAINLERLYIDSKIENFDFIRELKSLKELTISNNELTDIKFIENLVKLEVLDLSSNNISSVDELSELKNIKSLHLEKNRIIDISPIKNYSLIKTLYLNRNHIEDYNVIDDILDQITDTDIKLFLFYDDNLDKAVRKALKKETGILTLNDIKNLKSLDASGSGIENIGGIENMTSLVSLNLSENFIESIDGAEKLINLEVLKLRNNKINDISQLLYLDKLAILDLSFNVIESVKPLPYLKALEFLYLEGNNIEDGDIIEEMRKTLKGTDDW